VDVGFASLGEQRLKNITNPVRVYRVLLNPGDAGKKAGRPYWPNARLKILAGAGALLLGFLAFAFEWRPPLAPQRPSVAVLPFANLSGDPAQDYFADGVTGALTTNLAKLSGLDVTARNSAYAYKGRPVVLADVARDLGVRYVVEGSVQRAGEQVRINAQLVGTTTGDHLWADQFDRGAAQVFAVQDEMSRDIVKALGMTPTALETQRMARPPTANLEAYDYYLRGEQAARTGRPAALREALDFYAKAVALDPSFAEAYAADARTAVNSWRYNYDDVLQSAVARRRAYENAGRALQLNPDLSLPYAILAILQVIDKRYEEAIESAKRAVALGLGDVEAHIALGYVYLVAGKFAEAAASIETALKLDPNLSPIDRLVAGLVFFFNGENDRAIATLERARDDAPSVGQTLISLGAAYTRAGRIADARAAVAEGIRFPPNYSSLAAIRIIWAHFRNDKDLKFLIDALREAGLPEWPFGFSGADHDRLNGAPHRAGIADDDADRRRGEGGVQVFETVPDRDGRRQWGSIVREERKHVGTRRLRPCLPVGRWRRRAQLRVREFEQGVLFLARKVVTRACQKCLSNSSRPLTFGQFASAAVTFSLACAAKSSPCGLS
jgi:adenylate cyclase